MTKAANPLSNIKKKKKQSFPGFMSPMLATLTEAYFDHQDWIYERKLDGIRCLLLKNGTTARLVSRNKKDLSATFPEILEKAPSLSRVSLIADGELVAFEGKVSSFSKIQDRLPIRENASEAAGSPKVYLYLFDLIYYDSWSLTAVPLVKRKLLLKDLLSYDSPFRYTPYRRENGKEYLRDACRKGWEGVIAKEGGSVYTHGRSRKWLKFKCSHQQELVIGGFTEPEGSRVGFGAMLVGYYHKGRLLFAGKVGTGFDDRFLEAWRPKLDAIETSKSPFDNYSDPEGGSNHWVEPRYVGEFRFTEWTTANKLRHPSFLGIRVDKKAEEVKKETADENSGN